MTTTTTTSLSSRCPRWVQWPARVLSSNTAQASSPYFPWCHVAGTSFPRAASPQRRLRPLRRLPRPHGLLGRLPEWHGVHTLACSELFWQLLLLWKQLLRLRGVLRLLSVLSCVPRAGPPPPSLWATPPPSLCAPTPTLCRPSTLLLSAMWIPPGRARIVSLSLPAARRGHRLEDHCRRVLLPGAPLYHTRLPRLLTPPTYLPTPPMASYALPSQTFSSPLKLSQALSHPRRRWLLVADPHMLPMWRRVLRPAR